MTCKFISENAKMLKIWILAVLLAWSEGVKIEQVNSKGHVTQQKELSSVWCAASVTRYPGMWRQIINDDVPQSSTLPQCVAACIRRGYTAILDPGASERCACALSLDTSRCESSQSTVYGTRVFVFGLTSVKQAIASGGAFSVRGIGADYSCPRGVVSSAVSTRDVSGVSCSAQCLNTAPFAIHQSSVCACLDVASLSGSCTRGAKSSSSSSSVSQVFVVSRHVLTPRTSLKMSLRQTRGRIVHSLPSSGQVLPVRVGSSGNPSSGNSQISWHPPQLPYFRRARQYSLAVSFDYRRYWLAGVTSRHDVTLMPSSSTTSSSTVRTASVNYAAKMDERPGINKANILFLNGERQYEMKNIFKIETSGHRSADGSFSLKWPAISALPAKPSGAESLYYRAVYVYKFYVRSQQGGASSGGGGGWYFAASKSYLAPQQNYRLKLHSGSVLAKHNSLQVQVHVAYRRVWKLFEIPTKLITVKKPQSTSLLLSWKPIGSLPGQPVRRYRYLVYYWPAQQPQATPTLVVRESASPLHQLTLGSDGTVKSSVQQYRARVVIMFINKDSQAFLMDPTSVGVEGNRINWSVPSVLSSSASTTTSSSSPDRYRVRVFATRLTSPLARGQLRRELLVDQVTGSSVPDHVIAAGGIMQRVTGQHRLLVYVQRMPAHSYAASVPQQALLSMPRVELPESDVHVFHRPGQNILVRFRPIIYEHLPNPAYYLIFYTPLVDSPVDFHQWRSKLVALPRQRSRAQSTTNIPHSDAEMTRVLLPRTDGSQPYLVKVFHVPTSPAGIIMAEARPVAGKPRSRDVHWRVSDPNVHMYGVFAWNRVNGGSNYAHPRFLRVASGDGANIAMHSGAGVHSAAGGSNPTSAAGGGNGAGVSWSVRVEDIPSSLAQSLDDLVFFVSPLPTQLVFGGTRFVFGARVQNEPNRRFVAWTVRDTSERVFSVSAVSGRTGRVTFSRLVSVASPGHNSQVTEGQRVSTYVTLPSSSAGGISSAADGTSEQQEEFVFVIVPVLRLPKVSGTIMWSLPSSFSASSSGTTTATSGSGSSPATFSWTVSDPSSATASYAIFSEPSMASSVTSSSSNDKEARFVSMVSSPNPGVGVVMSSSAPALQQRQGQPQTGHKQQRALIYSLHSQPIGGGMRFVFGTSSAAKDPSQPITIEFSLKETGPKVYAIYYIPEEEYSQSNAAHSVRGSGSQRNSGSGSQKSFGSGSQNNSGSGSQKSSGSGSQNNSGSGSQKSSGRSASVRPVFVRFVSVDKGDGSSVQVGQKVSVSLPSLSQLTAKHQQNKQQKKPSERPVFLIQPLPDQPGLGAPIVVVGQRDKSRPTNNLVQWQVQDASVQHYSLFQLPLDVTSSGGVQTWTSPQPQFITTWSLTGTSFAVRGTTLRAYVQAAPIQSKQPHQQQQNHAQLFVVVPQATNPLVAGTEFIAAQRRSSSTPGKPADISASWVVRDQTVKRYLFFDTVTTSGTYDFGRMQFIQQRDAGKNPQTGQKLSATLAQQPQQQEPHKRRQQNQQQQHQQQQEPKANLLVYPVPNQWFHDDGCTSVLGSDFSGNTYAVRWVIRRPDVRWYLILAHIPGRRPAVARSVDLGQQVIAGVTRTDYVTGLMPGVQYNFFVVPVADDHQLSRSLQISGSTLSLAVPTQRTKLDYYIVVETPNSGSNVEPKTLAVVPAVVQLPNGARKPAAAGDEIAAKMTQTPSTGSRSLVLGVRTSHLLDDWPQVDDPEVNDPLSVQPRSQPLAAVHSATVQSQRIDSANIKLTWSAPVSLDNKLPPGSQLVYVLVYRVTALDQEWQLVHRLVVGGSSKQQQQQQHTLTVSAGIEPDTVKYVAVYYATQPGTHVANIQSTPSSSQSSTYSSSVAKISWSLTELEGLQYSVFAGGASGSCQLIKTVPMTTTLSRSQGQRGQLPTISRSSSAGGQKISRVVTELTAAELASVVALPKKLSIDGASGVGDKVSQLTTIVFNDMPFTPLPDRNLKTIVPQRITWTVDTRDIIGYGVFVMRGHSSVVFTPNAVITPNNNNNNNNNKGNTATSQGRSSTVKDELPVLKQTVPVDSSKIPLGTSLTVLLYPQVPDYRYRYFVVPILQRPLTEGHVIPGDSLTRRVIWILPSNNNQIRFFVVFRVRPTLQFITIVPKQQQQQQQQQQQKTASSSRTASQELEQSVRVRLETAQDRFIVLGITERPQDAPVTVRYPVIKSTTQASIIAPSGSNTGTLKPSQQQVKPLTLSRSTGIKTSGVQKRYFNVDTLTTGKRAQKSRVVDLSVTQQHLSVTTETHQTQIRPLSGGRIDITWSAQALRSSPDKQHQVGYLSVVRLDSSLRQHNVAVLSPDSTHYVMKALASQRVRYVVQFVLVPRGSVFVRGVSVTSHPTQRRVIWSAIRGVTTYTIYQIEPLRRPFKLQVYKSPLGGAGSELEIIVHGLRPGVVYYFLVVADSGEMAATTTSSRSTGISTNNNHLHMASQARTAIFQLPQEVASVYAIFFGRQQQVVPYFAQLSKSPTEGAAGGTMRVLINNVPSGEFVARAVPLPSQPNGIEGSGSSGKVVHYTLSGGWAQYALFVANATDKVSTPTSSSSGAAGIWPLSVVHFVSVVEVGASPQHGQRVTFPAPHIDGGKRHVFFVAPLTRAPMHNTQYSVKFAGSSAQFHAVFFRESGRRVVKFGALVSAGSNLSGGQILSATIDGLKDGLSYQFFKTSLPQQANSKGERLSGSGSWRVKISISKTGVSQVAVFVRDPTSSLVRFDRVIDLGMAAPLGATLHTQLNGLPDNSVHYEFIVVAIVTDDNSNISQVSHRPSPNVILTAKI